MKSLRLVILSLSRLRNDNTSTWIMIWWSSERSTV